MKATHIAGETDLRISKMKLEFIIDAEMLIKTIHFMTYIDETVTSESVEKHLKIILWNDGRNWFHVNFDDIHGKDDLTKAQALAQKLFPSYFP
jgi:hypothetical protein